MTTAESEIYFYAFRYCLGRMTYAVTDFCQQATKVIVEIKTHDLELMDKEITEAEQRHNEGPDMNWLGHDCDRREWLKFRETVRQELEKRK
jgi:hypothetical protein